MTQNEKTARLVELVKDASTAVLTSLSREDKLTSRPMAIQEAEANVPFESKHTWVSPPGRGRIVHDRAKPEENWSTSVDAWFPDGIVTPRVALLKVEAESAHYREAKGGPVKRAIELLKAGGSDHQPEIGQTKKVELSGDNASTPGQGSGPRLAPWATFLSAEDELRSMNDDGSRGLADRL